MQSHGSMESVPQDPRYLSVPHKKSANNKFTLPQLKNAQAYNPVTHRHRKHLSEVPSIH